MSQKQLSGTDIERINSLNATIDTIPKDILALSKNKIIETLNSSHPMNRIIRGPDGQIDAYLACSEVNNDSPYFSKFPDKKVVHITYAFSNGKHIANLRDEVTKFVKKAHKQGYELIIFNGINKKLTTFLQNLGFEPLNDEFAIYQLTPLYYGPEGRKLKEQHDYLAKDANASTVRRRLSKEQQDHITELLIKYNSNNKDPLIYMLYGTIHTLLHHRKNVLEYRSLDNLYKTAKELNTISSKETLSKEQTELLLSYVGVDQNHSNYAEIYAEIQKSIKTVKDKQLNTHIKSILHKHQITFDETILINRTWLNNLAGPSTTRIGKLASSIFPYTAYTLNTKQEMTYETAILKHCVGDSDFYISKVQKNQIKVISLRDEKNIPHRTIEYDIQTQTIKQFKGFEDKKVNSVPESSELILTTLDILQNNGYPIQMLKEDLNVTILRNISQNKHQLHTDNIISKLLSGEYHCIQGNIVYGHWSMTKQDILKVSSLPGITLDLTSAPINIKESLVHIEGNLIDRSPNSNYKKLTYIGGDSDFNNLTNAKGLSSLEYIGGNADFSFLSNTTGLSSLKHIGGNTDFSFLSNTTGLSSLKHIGGNADFSNIIDATGLSSLEYIGGNANFSFLSNTKGLSSLEHIGGNANFSNIIDATGLSSLRHIGSNADFIKLPYTTGLSSLEHIGGRGDFSRVTDATGLSSLRHIGRYLDFRYLTDATGLSSLEHIGGNVFFYNLTDATGLSSLRHIGGNIKFYSLSEEEKKKIPALQKK